MKQNARMFPTVDAAVSHVRTNKSLTLEQARAYVDKKCLMKGDNFIWILLD